MSIYRRWKAKLAVRKRLLDAAKKRDDRKLVKQRQKQVAKAERVVKRHRPLPLRLRALAVAKSKVGIVEVGGNNRGRDVEEIIKANGGVPGEPWCGDFVAYCYLKAGAKSVTRAWASVSLLGKVLSRVRRPKPGHVVRYSFDHTGLFYRWVNKSAGEFEAIEGNTGNVGAVSDSAHGGDGVKIKRRNISQVTDFRRVTR